MMDLTPHWEQIRRGHAEAHAILQQVAEAIYERSEEPVHSRTDGVNLSAALELGLLESNDEGIAFSNPDVRRDYLVRHTVSLALQAWDDPKTFASVLQNAQHRTLNFGTQREVTTLVLLVLSHDHGKDVVGRMGEVARLGSEGEGRNHLFWSLYNPFCEALPGLAVEPRELVGALESVFEATANDGAGGFIYGAVEKLAARSRSDADALYQVFASRSDSPVVTFVPTALVGLASFDLPEAHRRALDLAEAEQPALRRAGIAALGLFDYAGGGHHDLLARTWECLEDYRYETNPEVDYMIARAYGNLLGQKPEAGEALVELAVHQDSAVQNQIAFVLFHRAAEAHSETWYRRALVDLARAPTSQMETWENLDHCAARCAKEAPGLVIEFAAAMVLSRDYGTKDEKAELPEMLGTALSELGRHHPEVLEAAVTRWFASSERRLHRAARDVVRHYHYALDEGSPWPKLSKPVLDELDEQTSVYVLCRIMGHIVIGGRSLAALLLSAVRQEACSPNFLNFLTSMLAEHVLYNFPGEAGDYLRSRVESGDASETEREVVQAALENSEAYFEALRGLPDLKEFQPPSQHLYLLRLAQHKQRAAIMDEVDKRSVVTNLFPKVPLKYGRGFFMERDSDFSEPSELGVISHSVELPRGEMIDPIGQMLQRLRWQSIGLNEGEDHRQDDPEKDADA